MTALASTLDERPDDVSEFSWVHSLTLAVMIFGILCRVCRYVWCPSYWNDEAAIVLNVIDRDFTALLKPLDYAQAAPPLFLWGERCFLLAFGASEYSLRVLPFLFDVGSVLLFAALARRTLPGLAASWAIAWFCLSDKLIIHGGEVKPYSGDVFVTVLLLLLSMRSFKSRIAFRGMLPASMAAAIAIWLSYPALFVYGGISIASAWSRLRAARGDDPARGAFWREWVAGNALVGGSFIALLALVLRQPHDAHLDTFWAGQFPDWSHPFKWMASSLYQLADYPYSSAGILVLPVMIFGAMAFRRIRAATIPALLLIVLLLNLVAAVGHRYPFAGKRLSLYLLPLFFLLMGAGAERLLRQWNRNWVGYLGAALVASLFALTFAQTAHHLFRPEAGSWIRPVAARVKAKFQPGDAIYLVADGDSRRDRVTGRNIELLCYWRNPPGPLGFRVPSAAPLPGEHRRFWVVYSTTRERERPDALKSLRSLVHSFADEIEVVSEGGAGALCCARRE